MDFTIYYLATSTGFTSPTWNGYPAVMLDAVPGAVRWLLGHGLPLDTDLVQDLNDDGVSLLVAYALDLNPARNLSGRLPATEVHPDGLSLRFYGKASGITYRVQTSTNLRNWTSEGVTISEPEPDGTRIATVTRDEPHRFLRLVVELE